MKTQPAHFIVIYDDGYGYTNPYTWDPDCPGAITGRCEKDPVALFLTRKSAQLAIQISTAYAKLCKAQGKPVNEDFTIQRKNIKIIPCLAL